MRGRVRDAMRTCCCFQRSSSGAARTFMTVVTLGNQPNFFASRSVVGRGSPFAERIVCRASPARSYQCPPSFIVVPPNFAQTTLRQQMHKHPLQPPVLSNGGTLGWPQILTMLVLRTNRGVTFRDSFQPHNSLRLEKRVLHPQCQGICPFRIGRHSLSSPSA